jgi:glycosyltransferase involved in cell wall biosynthesis
LKILLCSHKFAPSVGGIETVSHLLAEELTRAGAGVTVVTQSPNPNPDVRSYPIVRQPSHKLLKQLARNSDIIFQSNISAQTLLPLLTLRKPIVVTTQTWIARANGTRAWQDHLKRFLLRFVHNVSISGPIAASISRPSVVIPNPFEMALFTPFRNTPKTAEIVFLGRLVSDKGCDTVIEALSLLKIQGITPTFTVIGDGPEATSLKTMAQNLDLSAQVTFVGNLGEARALEVSRHKVMVIPSRWAEPFGVVALEGIATGCAIVASSQGGLPEAVGRCGLFFPNGDAAALAKTLRQVLTDDSCRTSLIANGPKHLERFAPARIAREYLDLFASLIGTPS